MNMKKLFLLNLPYLLFVYPFDKLAQAFRLAPGADLSGKLLSIGDGFTAALSSPWLSFHPTDLLIGIAGAVILRMAVYKVRSSSYLRECRLQRSRHAHRSAHPYSGTS